MTLFDLVVFGVIVISGLAGLSRGAVHELIGLFAFTLSTIATIAFLPATTPLVRHVVHSGFLAAAVAAVISFVIVFIFLKILATTITASLNGGGSARRCEPDRRPGVWGASGGAPVGGLCADFQPRYASGMETELDYQWDDLPNGERSRARLIEAPAQRVGRCKYADAFNWRRH